MSWSGSLLRSPVNHFSPSPKSSIFLSDVAMFVHYCSVEPIIEFSYSDGQLGDMEVDDCNFFIGHQ